MLHTPPLGRRDAVAAGLLAAVVVTASGLLAQWPVVGYFHDDAVYLVTTRAVVEGDGYRLASLPGTPPQTKYPYLYPAVLAAVWRLCPTFPGNLVALKLVSLAAAAVFLPLAYLYLVRFGYASRCVALLACALCGTGLQFGYFTTAVMSEMLFAVLVLAALWRLERAAETTANWAGDLTLGVLLALPFLCRSIGLVFLPLGLYLLHRAGRPVWRVALTSAACIAPWLLWTAQTAFAWRADPVAGYYTDYLGWWLAFGPAGLLRVVALNGIGILGGPSALGCDGLATGLEAVHPLLAVALTVVPGMLSFAVLGRQLVRGRVLPVCLAGYLLVVLVWPWFPARFLLPFLPVLLAFALAGVVELLGHRLTPRVGLAAAVVLLACNVALLAHQYVNNPAGSRECYDNKPIAWRDRQAVFAWVEAHTTPDDVLTSGSDQMLALFTRRRAFYPVVCSPLSFVYGMPEAAPYHDLDRSLAAVRHHRPRYLVVMPGCHGERDFLAWVDALRRAYPDHVVPVYRGDDERFTIYELRYPLATGG